MLPFEPVTLTYKGRDYEVPPDRVWGLIGSIENVISRTKLAIRISEQDLPETKVAEAYVAALRYAGCKVQAHELTIGAQPGDLFGHALALFAIMNLALQPEGFKQDDAGATGEQKPGTKAPAKQRTKSGRAGA